MTNPRSRSTGGKKDRTAERPPATRTAPAAESSDPTSPPVAGETESADPAAPPADLAGLSSLVLAARRVSAGADELSKAAAGFVLTSEKLQDLTTAYKKVTSALGDVDSAVRKVVKAEALLKEVDDLLAVAALSESLREWFPVDPEMTSIRGTVLVPKAMTDKKPDPPKPEKPEDKSFDVLLKELLAHLAK